MSGGHSHGVSAASAHRGRLLAVLAITLVVLIAEIIASLITGSLALLADAGHLFTDAAGVGLALLAVMAAGRPATPERSFGYLRLEILAAVVNALLLFGVAAFVLFEAVQRLNEPSEVSSGLMLVVATIGLAANGVSLALLRRGSSESLNVRGAYLEVLGDLLGSVAVVVAGVVIATTGYDRADAIASVLIALLILPRTYKLLRDAVDILLEATPKGVDLNEVRRHIMETSGVVDVHDLHAWTITSGVPALSAHVVIDERAMAEAKSGEILDRLGDCLGEHFDISHCTFQLEPTGHAEHEHPVHD